MQIGIVVKHLLCSKNLYCFFLTVVLFPFQYFVNALAVFVILDNHKTVCNIPHNTLRIRDPDATRLYRLGTSLKFKREKNSKKSIIVSEVEKKI